MLLRGTSFLLSGCCSDLSLAESGKFCHTGGQMKAIQNILEMEVLL